MAILVDSSFLYSLMDKSDSNGQLARDFVGTNREPFIVPGVTLFEVTHVLRHRIGQHAVTSFLRLILELQIPLGPILISDAAQALTIMEQYPDARLDFVDCCIMALSERLNVTQICTFDRRDFMIFRPSHCDYLELLP